MPKRAYGLGARARAKSITPVGEPGRGGDYEPFLTIQDLSSHGRSSRMTGNVPGRIHHMLSDNERAVFLALLYAEGTVEIREQFALELDETIRIAAEAGIVHPRSSDGDSPAVMTTDFVVTHKSRDGTIDSAIAVKPAGELDNCRIIEKFEIERRYWKEKNVSWQICTDREMTLDRKNYLLWLHGREDFSHLSEPYEGYWGIQCDRFLKLLRKGDNARLRDLFDQIDVMDGARSGDGLAVLRQMLAARRLRLKENFSIDLDGTTDQLLLSTSDIISSVSPNGDRS